MTRRGSQPGAPNSVRGAAFHGHGNVAWERHVVRKAERLNSDVTSKTILYRIGCWVNQRKRKNMY